MPLFVEISADEAADAPAPLLFSDVAPTLCYSPAHLHPMPTSFSSTPAPVVAVVVSGKVVPRCVAATVSTIPLMLPQSYPLLSIQLPTIVVFRFIAVLLKFTRLSAFDDHVLKHEYEPPPDKEPYFDSNPSISNKSVSAGHAIDTVA